MRLLLVSRFRLSFDYLFTSSIVLRIYELETFDFLFIITAEGHELFESERRGRQTSESKTNEVSRMAPPTGFNYHLFYE